MVGKIKILLLGVKRNRHNWGFELFRKTLGEEYDVTYYGPGYIDNYQYGISINKIIASQKNKPDFILVHLPQSFEHINKLGEVDDILKVHIMGDYHYDFPLQGNYVEFLDYCKFDLIFAQSIRVLDILEFSNVASYCSYLPFSVDTCKYRKFPNTKKRIDVMAVFAHQKQFYSTRKLVRQTIHEMKGVKHLLKGVYYNDYVRSINEAKIFVNSNSKYRSINMKYTEVLACGTLFLTDKPTQFEEHGFEDKVHMVLYNTISDMKMKIRYYLEHEEEREQIALTGMKFVRENYSNKVIVKQLVDTVRRKLLC